MPFPFPRGVFPWAVSPATGYHSLKHSCGWQQTHHTTKVPGEFNTFRLRSPQTVSVDSAMNETGIPVSLRQMHPNCLTSRHFSVHANNAACAPSCHKAPILSRQTSIPCTSRPCLLTVHFRNADLSRQVKTTGLAGGLPEPYKGSFPALGLKTRRVVRQSQRHLLTKP